MTRRSFRRDFDQMYHEQFRKTRLCRWYEQGRCDFPNCRFAHGIHELRQRPSLRCTSICPALTRWGACTNPQCEFAHSKSELRATPIFDRTVPCREWLSGHCENPNCRWRHSESEDHEALKREMPPLIPPSPPDRRTDSTDNSSTSAPSVGASDRGDTHVSSPPPPPPPSHKPIYDRSVTFPLPNGNLTSYAVESESPVMQTMHTAAHPQMLAPAPAPLSPVVHHQGNVPFVTSSDPGANVFVLALLGSVKPQQLPQAVGMAAGCGGSGVGGGVALQQQQQRQRQTQQQSQQPSGGVDGSGQVPGPLASQMAVNCNEQVLRQAEPEQYEE